MMMETGNYSSKHILIEDNNLFTMTDERILTGCRANRSSLRGLVRLVPKIMNPELMPAEWRALSKLEHTRNLNISLYFKLEELCDVDLYRDRIMLLWEELSLTLKWRGRRWRAAQPGWRKCPTISAKDEIINYRMTFNLRTNSKPGQERKRFVFKGIHWVREYNLPVMSFVKERPYGLARHSLALMPTVTGGKQWHTPDRAGRFQPGRRKVGGSQKGNKPHRLLAFKEPLCQDYFVPAEVMSTADSHTLGKTQDLLKK